MIVPQAKKTEERGEERGKRRLRHQKSKQKYLKKQNKQQCREPTQRCFRRFCTPGAGRKPQGKQWVPQAQKSGKT
jgi:hypothetical protein